MIRAKFVCIRQPKVALAKLAFVISILVLSTNLEPGACQRRAKSRAVKAGCGTEDQIAERVGRCMDPIFDIIEGRVPAAKSDADLVSACDRFANTEKCVRQIAKDCLMGLQKTSTSAVASATKRFRINECKTPATRAKYVEPMRCCVKKGKDMTELYHRSTAIAQAIRDLPGITAEEKVMKVCCLLLMIDREIETQFNADCPQATKATIDLVHAMTDDARSTLCVSPKCHGGFDANIRKAKYQPPQNLIEPIMQILFMLGNTE